MPADSRHALPFWLHSRYVLAATVLLALLAVLTAGTFVAYERRELQNAAQARGALFARVLEDQANRTLNGVEVALSAVAETTRLQHDSDADTGGTLSPLLQQSLRALPFLRSISLVDGQGLVVASSSPGNVGQRIPRQRLLPAGTTAGLGPLLPGRDLADLAQPAPAAGPAAAHLLPMVRPLADGAQGAWLVAAINPDYFANQYRLLLGDTPMQAALLSYGGQMLAASHATAPAAGTLLRDSPVFTRFLPARERGDFLAPGLDGTDAFATFRTARQQPLVVLVETPERTVQADVRDIAGTVAAGTAALLLLVGGLGTLAWRSLRSHEAVSGDLAAQHAFTDRLFQVSPIPMVVKDASGRFMRVNKAWTDFTGLPPERVIGANLGRIYPAQLAGPHEVQEQMAIASGQPVTYEEQMLDSDGLPRDVIIRVMPYTDASGEVAGVIGCLMDVTEFREAEQHTLEAKEAAERANTAKSEFLANISHELRTPLQSILGFSELGRLRSREQPRLQGMFNDIHGAGQRMLSLVNNLLDLSRLESTVGEIDLRPTDIAPALAEVVLELQQLARARRLRLVAPAADGQPALWAPADAFRLQQVLRNVLANAIRFAPEGSDIVIDWQHDGPAGLLVSVRDHGPGIPPDELDSIFGAFVQSSRTKDGAGGTGLGLAICRKIMDAHHGSIQARNHAEGGAVFEIRLPAAAQPMAEPLPAPATATT